jgi:hypothetical protein
MGQVLVASASNPSYSVGRGQEDCDLRPEGERKKKEALISKISNTK